VLWPTCYVIINSQACVVDNFLLISKLLLPSNYLLWTTNLQLTPPIPNTKSKPNQIITTHSQWVPSSLAYVTCSKATHRYNMLTPIQIKGVFQAIGRCIMAVVNAIGAICMAISMSSPSLHNITILTNLSQRHRHRLWCNYRLPHLQQSWRP